MTFEIKIMDVFGMVLRDHYQGNLTGKLWLHNDFGQLEDMPVEVFFRSAPDMPELEHYALNICQGKILDIGAGVGSHSLILQAKGFDVTALEISNLACDIMKARGVKSVINKNIRQYQEEKYDTLLLLMNGIGLCEDIEGLHFFLQHIKKLLRPGGQLIFDSSDISYLYDHDDFPQNKYYGEISYQYEYQYIKGKLFKWLYIDQAKLFEIAGLYGWHCQLIYEDGMDQYLTRLTLKE